MHRQMRNDLCPAAAVQHTSIFTLNTQRARRRDTRRRMADRIKFAHRRVIQRIPLRYPHNQRGRAVKGRKIQRGGESLSKLDSIDSVVIASGTFIAKTLLGFYYNNRISNIVIFRTKPGYRCARARARKYHFD